MNPNAAKQVAESFLRGFFDTLDALLASSISAKSDEAIALTEQVLARQLDTAPVLLRGDVKGIGPIAMLLSVTDTFNFSARVMGAEPTAKTALQTEDVATLKEVYEPCLGGGVGSLKDLFEQELAFEGFSIAQESRTRAGARLASFGADAYSTPFHFADLAGASGDGFVIVSKTLGGLVPSAGAEDANEPELTDSEMKDILSGFDPDSGATAPRATKATGGSMTPDNLDLVLDIGLTCTARLGQVEMPISEILELGPGSIIEVGHLVDEPVELLVNDKLIARGDVVVVDEKFGLRITEIISQEERIKSLV